MSNVTARGNYCYCIQLKRGLVDDDTIVAWWFDYVWSGVTNLYLVQQFSIKHQAILLGTENNRLYQFRPMKILLKVHSHVPRAIERKPNSNMTSMRAVLWPAQTALWSTNLDGLVKPAVGGGGARAVSVQHLATGIAESIRRRVLAGCVGLVKTEHKNRLLYLIQMSGIVSHCNVASVLTTISKVMDQ